MPGWATGVRSLLAPMTTIPVPSAMVALVGLLKVSAKRSIGGRALSLSSVMSTTTFLTVSPGAKVRVPLLAV